MITRYVKYKIKMMILGVCTLENIFIPMLRIHYPRFIKLAFFLSLSLFFFFFLFYVEVFHGALVVKNPPAKQELNLWIWKIPWWRKWQPIPVFLPGKFHWQRNLTSYSPWCGKESHMIEHMVTMKVKVKVKVTQSCPTLHDPIDCTAHGILQARILK